jgi:hypothetical protein
LTNSQHDRHQNDLRGFISGNHHKQDFLWMACQWQRDGACLSLAGFWMRIGIFQNSTMPARKNTSDVCLMAAEKIEDSRLR